MTETPLRILVVDDSVTYRRIVSRALEGLPGVDVVGTAPNGSIAMEKIGRLHPDLLTLDLEMPEMNGLELLRRLKNMGSTLGAIMLSAFTAEDADSTLTALKLGAFDYVLKPPGGDPQANAETLRRELGRKIEAFSLTRKVRKIARGEPLEPKRPVCPSRPGTPSDGSTAISDRMRRVCTLTAAKPQVVGIGISTGGPPALTKMLPKLPADLSAPILIVQHMPPVFTQSFAADLDRRCALSVSEASDGQLVEPGHVLVAPGGKQMKVEQVDGQKIVRITNDPPECSCRPSVDYLFRSLAEVYQAKSLGVIMTGMGNDGFRGCQEMKRHGATIIAQDEASCVVFGMPREPVEQGVADTVVPLDRIDEEILHRTGRRVLAFQ